jgi:murein DD-endopeptidase MepM/ murein hydrolase activator NlpD
MSLNKFQISALGGLAALFTFTPLKVMATSLYRLPYPDGMSYTVASGNFGDSVGHEDSTGYNTFAWDFDMSVGTPVVAAQAGTVIRADFSSQTEGCIGNPSYCDQFNNIVVIDHGNGESSLYLHLQFDSGLVNVGDTVAQGQQIGLSGNTGMSSGPHLHFGVMTTPLPGRRYGESIPSSFADPDVLRQNPNGIPVAGRTYTSSNALNNPIEQPPSESPKEPIPIDELPITQPDTRVVRPVPEHSSITPGLLAVSVLGLHSLRKARKKVPQ